MDGVGLALTAAQTLLATLACEELKEVFTSVKNFKANLEDIARSAQTIKAVLEDADEKQSRGLELSNQERDLLERIKEVVYDAEDLLDEYAARAQLQHLFEMKGRNEVSRKVRSLCYRLKKRIDNHSMSPEVKKTAKLLDDIARDARFKMDCPPIRRSWKPTSSHVYEKSIIGRDDDKKRIVDILLDPKYFQKDIYIQVIVGMGGLGKTTLAQLVYNDPNIDKEFPRKVWVCVSDKDQNQFSATTILTQILKSVTGERHIGDPSLDQVVHELKSKLQQHKYLLVLDDVWTENPNDWRELETHFWGLGQAGSKIVVTTRSKKTAFVVGSNHSYELKGLSDEDSWHLFQIMAWRDEAKDAELVGIGQDIVKKCANVPLAINVVASLLRGQPKNTWQSLQRNGFTTKEHGDDIMQTLKFSYYHLPLSVKNCFSYCALFPKGTENYKEILINLWIANGFVKGSDGSFQSMEEKAEEYFQILVQRCFFQEAKTNKRSPPKLVFEIHDLLHDMAKEVAGGEIFGENDTTSSLVKKVRHILACDPDVVEKLPMVGATIRTALIYHSFDVRFRVNKLIVNWRRLRALDLSHMDIESLPNTIGSLYHLRLFDVSSNHRLEMLPESLTKLVNLLILNLEDCHSLKELPKNFRQLANLTVLKVSDQLSYMPSGFGKLTCLSRLNCFPVGERESLLKQDVGGLEDLAPLTNLRGTLEIRINANFKHVKKSDGEGGYLSNKEHLNHISIIFPKVANEGELKDQERVTSDEAVLEDLQPREKLKQLEIRSYLGTRIPSWAIEDNLANNFPNLVEISFVCCDGLQSLPWLGKLPSLKKLSLANSRNLEYVEDRTSRSDSSSDVRVDFIQENSFWTFFPSLKVLSLSGLPKLKEWRRGLSMPTSKFGSGMMDEEMVNRHGDSSTQSIGGHRLPSFPRLSKLSIYDCPHLTTIPPCPTVETLYLRYVNDGLEIRMKEDGNSRRDHRMGKLTTNNMKQLKSLPMSAFRCPEHMGIYSDDEVESLSEVSEFLSNCSSLQFLKVVEYNKLRSVSGGLEYLTNLKSLKLYYLPELRLDEEEDGMPWRSLHRCLRRLELVELPEMVNLPKGMQYLTALQSLRIHAKKLEALPEWIGCLSSLQSLQIDKSRLPSLPEAMQKLTSLKQLRIYICPADLQERCQNPQGVDWPKIRHINNILITQALSPPPT